LEVLKIAGESDVLDYDNLLKEKIIEKHDKS